MKYRPADDPNVQAADQAKRQEAIAIERRRWWELAESYRRCVQIARDNWDDELRNLEAQQQELAERMRDRVAPGVRATGVKYDADRSIPVPLFTPRDRVQFIKEVATTLLISADRQNLPVTPEAKREAQPDEKTQAVEAGSGVDEALGDEAQELAQAGERPLETVTDATLANGVALP